jgi:hypothetical protein
MPIPKKQWQIEIENRLEEWIAKDRWLKPV